MTKTITKQTTEVVWGDPDTNGTREGWEMTRTITIQLTEWTFERCVGRPPKNDAEMEEFAGIWEDYEWEDLIAGGWDDLF